MNARTYIGVAIASDRVRVAVVRRGVVTAIAEAEIGPDDQLADVVAEALAGAPVARFPRPRVRVVLGPGCAQMRRVAGLPRVRDPRVLARVVREGAGRFFVLGSAPVVTTGVRMEGEGVAWCAALDASTVTDARAGCGAAGFRVAAFVPVGAVLPHALADGRWRWRDGALALQGVQEGGAVVSLRRMAAAATEAEAEVAPHPVPALAALGPEGWRFADAYGAAILPASEPLVLHAEAPRAAGPVPAWRLGAAAAALACAAGFAAVAPAWRATQARDAALRGLAPLRTETPMVRRAEAELGRLTAALNEVAALEARRRSPTLLLGALARALPPGSALVEVRADSAGGDLVAVAPRAAALLPALERTAGLAPLVIAGPVTREHGAGQPLERMTVRFGAAARRGR